MKEENKIDNFVRKNPIIAIVVAIIVIGIIIAVGLMTYKKVSPKNESTEVSLVEFGDDQNSVLVERNGKVTIKTPDGQFSQNWDKEKTRRFFEDLDKLDFDSLSEYIGGNLALKLVIGKQIVRISIDDPRIGKIVDNIQTELEEAYEKEIITDDYPYYYKGSEQDGILGKVEKETDKKTVDGGTVIYNTPIPITPGSTASPNTSDLENPWEEGIYPEDESKFTCEEVDPVTGKKVIISNTVCIE